MKILLHTCCAPCTTEVIERLKKDEIVLFFSNSNIYPKDEYLKRLENAEKISKIYNLKLLVDLYNHEKWLEFIKGLEDEKEGGKRCLKCFEFNLRLAAKKANELNINNFTTTLTISPYKNSKEIFSIAKEIEKEFSVNFLDIDFKKKEGFKKSIILSNKYNLYRQSYCGCEFSLRRSIASPKE